MTEGSDADGAGSAGPDAPTGPQTPALPPSPPLSPPPGPEAMPSSTASSSAVQPPAASLGAGQDGAPEQTGAQRRAARRRARLHPYALEASTPEEHRRGAAQVTMFWFSLATLLAVAGMALDRRFNPDPVHPNPAWLKATLFPLFGGLGLLAFGFVRATWSKRFTLAGWLLFGSYWGLTAFDLLYAEGQDYVNFIFAIVGVYFFTYLAYHQWLSLARRVDNEALHFLNASTFVAAGAYFVIDKIEPVQRWLIIAVANQTNWVLNLFGQGQAKGLVYALDPNAQASVSGVGPASFYYPQTFDTCPEGTTYGAFLNDNAQYVRDYAAAHPGPDPNVVNTHAFQQWCADRSDMWIHTWWDQIRHFAPDGDHIIATVSIILACTALQSIMLFVGLVMGARAPLKQKLLHSAWVGILVYLLNLLRNTGIIWFYGQGETSFWVMHNAVGKGGSLIAMVGIAFLLFKLFPPFFTSLVSVLDLPDRDGPVERTLRIGRRRPTQENAA